MGEGGGLTPKPSCGYGPENDYLISDAQTEQNKENSDAIKELELKGVKSAESGNLDAAMHYFNDAIFKDPKKASSYNNRAQTFRLLGKNEGKLVY